MLKNDTATNYWERAGDFIRGASVLCSDIRDGWLPSAGLLLGFACELLAKQRLIHAGTPEDKLRNAPYGHDIAGMWRDKTKLFAEAESIVAELKKNPTPNGVDVNFNWSLHFDQLANGHSRSGDYSLRYHQGEIHFADPIAVTMVLSKVWLSERDKHMPR